jgi:hypothetical protein
MLALKAILLLFSSLTTHADMGEVFAELMGRPDRGGVKASYEVRQFETSQIGGHMLGLRHHTAQLNMPLNSLSDRKWKLMLNGGLEEIRTNARFPSGRPLPNQVWNAGAGISYMRLTEEDRTVGGYFQVGSHGDRPFGAFRDTSIEATAFYKIPQENEAAWIFFLSFANDRGFLNYVPLPGAAYFFRPHDKLRLALGVPFVMAFWSPFEKAVASLTYFPVNRGQVKFSYFLFGPAHFYLGARYQSENSFPSDRSARKERFFYEEAVADIGFSMPLERYLLADVSAGYSFDRKYFLGEGQTDWKENGLIVRAKKAPFATLRLTATF